MNIVLKIITFLITLSSFSPTICCPTCIGRLEKDTPAFFNDDFYRPYVEEKQETTQTQSSHELTEKNNND